MKENKTKKGNRSRYKRRRSPKPTRVYRVSEEEQKQQESFIKAVDSQLKEDEGEFARLIQPRCEAIAKAGVSDEQLTGEISGAIFLHVLKVGHLYNRALPLGPWFNKTAYRVKNKILNKDEKRRRREKSCNRIENTGETDD